MFPIWNLRYPKSEVRVNTAEEKTMHISVREAVRIVYKQLFKILVRGTNKSAERGTKDRSIQHCGM